MGVTFHTYGDGIAVGIELIEGRNVLVFKSVNDGGHWLGSVRFTTEMGDPVSGIELDLPEEYSRT